MNEELKRIETDITKIIYQNSRDSGEGLTIDFSRIQKVIEELTLLFRDKLPDDEWIPITAEEKPPITIGNKVYPVLCAGTVIGIATALYWGDNKWSMKDMTHWKLLPQAPTKIK